jgi:hypothetical protein
MNEATIRSDSSTPRGSDRNLVRNRRRTTRAGKRAVDAASQGDTRLGGRGWTSEHLWTPARSRLRVAHSADRNARPASRSPRSARVGKGEPGDPGIGGRARTGGRRGDPLWALATSRAPRSETPPPAQGPLPLDPRQGVPAGQPSSSRSVDGVRNATHYGDTCAQNKRVGDFQAEAPAGRRRLTAPS